ncbi:MAG TPA: TolC family protein, partial [Elusimicrobiota bacterium]|nr:TolC family protein [Elusimicrobiota bacterium]
MKKALLSGTLLFLGGLVRAEPLSLENLVRDVLARNPGLSAADAVRRAAQAQLSEARSQRLPRLTASSLLTRGDGPVYAFASLLDRRSFTASDFAVDALNRPGYATHLRSSLALGVPLFTGFALQSQERIGRL